MGLSGSNYDVVVRDMTNNEACTNDNYSPEGAPHYADTVVENPHNGNQELANFSSVTFTDLEMAAGSGLKLDQYPNYLNNWGLGSNMDDGFGTTTTSTMTEPTGYSYGTFSVTYSSST